MKETLLKIARNKTVQKAAIALALAIAAAAGLNLTGCGASISQLPAYDRCLAGAEAKAQARVDAECPADAGVCPAFEGIVAELEAAQKECRP